MCMMLLIQEWVDRAGLKVVQGEAAPMKLCFWSLPTLVLGAFRKIIIVLRVHNAGPHI